MQPDLLPAFGRDFRFYPTTVEATGKERCQNLPNLVNAYSQVALSQLV
jgi:hypothetical protein